MKKKQIHDIRDKIRQKNGRKRPSAEQITQMIIGRQDQDRARVNAVESHLLALDRTLQEYVRNTSGELQSLRAENEELREMLGTILDILGDDDDGKEAATEKETQD